MAQDKTSRQLSLWKKNFCLQSYTFYLFFFLLLLLLVWNRIRIRNTDPDPQSCWIRIRFGSVSTTTLLSRTEIVLTANAAGHFVWLIKIRTIKISQYTVTSGLKCLLNLERGWRRVRPGHLDCGELGEDILQPRQPSLLVRHPTLQICSWRGKVNRTLNTSRYVTFG